MKKLAFSILFILFLSFSPSLASTQEGSGTAEWIDIISHIVKEEAVMSKLKSYLHLGMKGPLKPDDRKCQYCTILAGASLTYAKIHNVTIDDFLLNKFCKMFPIAVRSVCDEFMKDFGKIIVDVLLKTASPDLACREVGWCNRHQCTLFPHKFHGEVQVSESWKLYGKAPPAPKSDEKPYSQLSLERITHLKNTLLGRLMSGKITNEELTTLMNFIQRLEKVGESPWDWIKELIEKWTGNHTTPIDLDHDSFSQLSPELRGYNWRGRDCNDYDAKTYPGRKTDPHPGLGRDYNCNGVKGINPKTKKAYKDELCANTQQLGVVVMGDSAGAHAEIPLAWFDATMWNDNTFKGIVEVVLNEVDLPHMSAYTGYAQTGIMGPVRSVYKYLHQRNKCNFRDYQNIAVNGASSGNCHNNNARLARHKTDDHPLLMFLELVGNDVCGHKPRFDDMTKPEDFRKSIIKVLDELDNAVPKGSHLVILGVFNGSIIHEIVKGRTHPVGVTYDQLYNYQNCLECSFCWGWLNTNQTIRELTTKRAYELNQVYRDLVKSYKPKNFDFAYYDFPADKIFYDYVKQGKDPLDLLEKTDGFHPSQTLHALLGDYLWELLLKEHPDWVGPVNPNNDLITQLFGNQGGY